MSVTSTPEPPCASSSKDPVVSSRISRGQELCIGSMAPVEPSAGPRNIPKISVTTMALPALSNSIFPLFFKRRSPLMSNPARPDPNPRRHRGGAVDCDRPDCASQRSGTGRARGHHAPLLGPSLVRVVAAPSGVRERGDHDESIRLKSPTAPSGCSSPSATAASARYTSSTTAGSWRASPEVTTETSTMNGSGHRIAGKVSGYLSLGSMTYRSTSPSTLPTRAC